MAEVDGTFLDERYAQDIFNKLNSYINNEIGTSALMGNLCAESCLTPYRVQGELSHDAEISLRYATAVCNGEYTEAQFLRAPYFEGRQYAKGFGLAQWTTDNRKAGLYNHRIENGFSDFGVDCTCTYLIGELESGYTSTRDVLQNATNLRTASDYVLRHFEAPADQSEAIQIHRATIGQYIYENYSGGTPPTPPDPPTPPAPTNRKGWGVFEYLGLLYR